MAAAWRVATEPAALKITEFLPWCQGGMPGPLFF
jgi:hypothetical protein